MVKIVKLLKVVKISENICLIEWIILYLIFASNVISYGCQQHVPLYTVYAWLLMFFIKPAFSSGSQCSLWEKDSTSRIHTLDEASAHRTWGYLCLLGISSLTPFFLLCRPTFTPTGMSAKAFYTSALLSSNICCALSFFSFLSNNACVYFLCAGSGCVLSEFQLGMIAGCRFKWDVSDVTLCRIHIETDGWQIVWQCLHYSWLKEAGLSF